MNFEDEGATCGHFFSNKKPKHSIRPVLFTWSFDKIKVLVLYQNSLHIWDWVPQTFGKSDYSQDDYSYSLCTFKKYRFWKLLKRGVSTKCIVWPVKPLMQHRTQLYTFTVNVPQQKSEKLEYVSKIWLKKIHITIKIVTTTRVGINRSLKWCPKMIQPELCSARKHCARVVFKFGTNVEENKILAI